MKVRIVLFLIFFSFFTSIGYTTAKVDGFFEMPWGYNENSANDKMLHRPNTSKINESEYFSLFSIRPAIIKLIFVEEKLASAFVVTSGNMETYSKYMDNLMQKYGQPDYQEDKTDYFRIAWLSSKTDQNANALIVDIRDNFYLKYRKQDLPPEKRFLVDEPYIIHFMYCDGTQMDNVSSQIDLQINKTKTKLQQDL